MTWLILLSNLVTAQPVTAQPVTVTHYATPAACEAARHNEPWPGARFECRRERDASWMQFVL